MDASTRRLVRLRAGNRCEYCKLPQESVDATFHVEHVTPRQHGGGDNDGNLALACDRCNLTKGPNLTGFDPETGVIVLLFNPRSEPWELHFELRGDEIIGLTPSGRATAHLFQMNAPRRRHLRAMLLARGEYG